MSYQVSFPAPRGLGFPFCPSPTVHSGNHAIHSAPPPSVLSLAKLHRFFVHDTTFLFRIFRPAQHRQRRHTGEVDFIAYSLFLRNFATHSSHRPYSAQGRDEFELSVSLPHSLGLDLFLLQGMYVPAQRCVCCILFRPLPAFSDPYQPSVPALSEGP